MKRIACFVLLYSSESAVQRVNEVAKQRAFYRGQRYIQTDAHLQVGTRFITPTDAEFDGPGGHPPQVGPSLLMAEIGEGQAVHGEDLITRPQNPTGLRPHGSWKRK